MSDAQTDSGKKTIEPQYHIDRIRKDIGEILTGLEGLENGTNICIERPHINDPTRCINWMASYQFQFQTMPSATSPRAQLSIDVRIAPHKDLNE